MRHNPKYAVTDEAVVRTLIEEHPWGTIVSQRDGELVASHYPILLEAGEPLTVVSHVGRPDEEIHGLGGHEVLLIVAGPHGYISPSWYAGDEPTAPTWNFSVAHCYGVPELLDLDENKAVLARLVAHFEDRVDEPAYLQPEVADRLAPGTVGFRLPITRFVCKVKMSQGQDEASQRSVLAHLRGDGPYANPALAADMERALRR
jgi:transcriptional regulator